MNAIHRFVLALIPAPQDQEHSMKTNAHSPDWLRGGVLHRCLAVVLALSMSPGSLRAGPEPSWSANDLLRHLSGAERKTFDGMSAVGRQEWLRALIGFEARLTSKPYWGAALAGAGGGAVAGFAAVVALSPLVLVYPWVGVGAFVGLTAIGTAVGLLDAWSQRSGILADYRAERLRIIREETIGPRGPAPAEASTTTNVAPDASASSRPRSPAPDEASTTGRPGASGRAAPSEDPFADVNRPLRQP